VPLSAAAADALARAIVRGVRASVPNRD